MNPRAWLLSVLLAFLGCLPACAYAAGEGNRAIEPQSKIALVIGNAHYTDALPLPNSANDASDMCAALKKLGFEVICKLDIATKREFKDAIYEFTGKINSRSVALFYYAGHAVQVEGINYLIPVKAVMRTKSDIEDEGVQINYLMSELQPRQALLNIFLLDACRNNPFANPIRGYVPMMGLATQLYAPRNNIIAMSAGPGQQALDGVGRNGTFTKNLLQNIGVPRLTIEDTLKAVSTGTRADAARLKFEQEPQLSSSFGEKFCLAGCGDPAPPAPDDGLLKAKTAELNRLQASIAEARAKQAELDSQQALLLKKRAELETARQGLADVEAKKEELERRRAEVARREQELDKLGNEVKTSADKLKELEAVRLSLQQKQEEIEKMRKTLVAQQATIDAANQEIATRSLKQKQEEAKKSKEEEKKAPPVPVVPTF